MKRLHDHKVFLKCMISAAITGVFILLALGSLNFGVKRTLEYDKETGIYTETVYYGLTGKIKSMVEGKRDKTGRWTGRVIAGYGGQGEAYNEDCEWENGERNGVSTIGHCDVLGTVRIVDNSYYQGGVRVSGAGKSSHIPTSTTAYDILRSEYPWFLYHLKGFDFTDGYLKAFTDTLEKVLNATPFEAAKFNSRYDAVVNELEETPYDSILIVNSEMFLVRGLEKLKSNPFRLAVIGHAWDKNKSTFSIVSTTYPGYLQTMNDSGVSRQDFEKFCLAVEDSIRRYGTLNPADPFFTDTVDARMFRAVFSFLEDELSGSAGVGESLKKALRKGLNSFSDLSQAALSLIPAGPLASTPEEVAALVASDMMNNDFIRGDILRAAVKKSWQMKKGIIVIPTATTALNGYNSDVSVNLEGYVTDAGGATVTSRGMVWATFFNPTVKDNSLAAGSGTGKFEVTISGLEKGKTWYARSYAVNSAGTSYGNCIEFIATIPVNLIDPVSPILDFRIYPNPSGGMTTFSFELSSPGKVLFIVTDLSGKEVMRYQTGSCSRGHNKVTADLSGLMKGIYLCRMICGEEQVVRKMVIER